MKNKLLSIVMLSAVAVQLAACGAAEEKPAESPEFETVSEVQADVAQEPETVKEESTENEAAEENTQESTVSETQVEETQVEENDAKSTSYEFEGQYYAGRGNLSILRQENGNFLIEVWWGSSAAEHSEWVMNGTYDESTNVITYNDCEKHDYTLKDNGEVESDITAYTDGTGNIKIVDANTIIWTDDQDHIADDIQMTR